MSKLIAVIATIGALAIITPVNAASTHIDPFQFSNEFSEVLAAGTTCHLAFDQKKINAFFHEALPTDDGTFKALVNAQEAVLEIDQAEMTAKQKAVLCEDAASSAAAYGII